MDSSDDQETQVRQIHLYVVRGEYDDERLVVFPGLLEEADELLLRGGMPIEVVLDQRGVLCEGHELMTVEAFGDIDEVYQAEPDSSAIKITAMSPPNWHAIHAGMQEQVADILGIEPDDIVVHDLCVDA